MPAVFESTLTYAGLTFSLARWAEITGFKIHILADRKRRGWDVNRIFETPPRKYRKWEQKPFVLADLNRQLKELRNGDMEGQSQKTIEGRRS